jgi:hypothetical protein
MTSAQHFGPTQSHWLQKLSGKFAAHTPEPAPERKKCHSNELHKLDVLLDEEQQKAVDSEKRGLATFWLTECVISKEIHEAPYVPAGQAEFDNMLNKHEVKGRDWLKHN